jgi:glycosyltransferase involved in cell wall biosynthesis
VDSKTILVVMPVYNAERTVVKAIDSVLKQTVRDLVHLVIVNDASTDKSLDKILKYVNRPNVTILTNTVNMGAYYSRNVGLYHHRNDPWEYFTTHDADDVSHRERFLRLCMTLKHPNVNAVQDVFRQLDYSSRENLGEKLTMAHALFKREVFDAIGYFEPVRFGADWEHWYRLGKHNRTQKKTTTTLKHVLGVSYIHGQNLTVQIPLDSPERKKYVAATRRTVRNMILAGDLYRDVDEQQIRETTLICEPL